MDKLKRLIPYLYVVVTIVLCIMLNRYVGPKSDYLLFTNVCILVLFAVFLFRIVFKKADKVTNKEVVMQMVCPIFLFIFTNHYYSYAILAKSFPFLQNMNAALWAIIAGSIIAILSIIFYVIRPIDSLSELEESAVVDEILIRTEKSVDSISRQGIVQKEDAYNREDTQKTDNIMKKLGSIMMIVFIIIGAILIFYKTANNKDIDVLRLINKYGSYFLILLFIIIAAVAGIMVVIELTKVMLDRLSVLLNRQQRENDMKSHIHLLSIIIFFAILYISVYVNREIIDELVEKLGTNWPEGQYIAIPVLMLILMVTFYIFVALISGILSMLADKESELHERMRKHITDIAELLVEIVFESLTCSLKFIKFIPDFFRDLYELALGQKINKDDK